MIAFRVRYNPQNKKFKVDRINSKYGAKDGDGVFHVMVPEDTDKLPSGVLLGAYNHTHSTQFKRFSSLQQARDEGYEALRAMSNTTEQNAEATAAETADKPKRSRKKKEEGAAAEPRGPRLTQITPKAASELKAARTGTKIANMIDLLAGGIFANDLKEKLQRKGRALSGRINRVHGYGVHSELQERDGKQEVFYTLVYPEGVTSPLPHSVPEEKPVKEPKAPKAEGEEGGKKSRTRKKKEEVTAGAPEGDGAAAVSA